MFEASGSVVEDGLPHSVTFADIPRKFIKGTGFQVTIGPMSFEPSVRILRSLPELEEIRPQWEAWPGHRDSHIDFFSEVVRSNPCTERPHVIVAYREGKPDAALIGRIDRTKLHLRVGYWRVPTPTVRLLTFAMGARRGEESSATSELLLRTALNSLRKGEADAARVDFVPADALLHHLSKSLPSIVGRDYGAESSPHWSMELPGSFSEVMQSFSGDFRNQLKRKAKKIEAKFPGVAFKCLEKLEDLEEIVRDVESVAVKSYQRALHVGFCDNPATRQSISSQLQKGRYLGYLLYLEGKLAAFWLGSFFDQVFYSDYLAFDPEYSDYSAGIYLQAKVLEDLIARKAIRIDFGPGDARYKSQLGTSCQQEVTLHMFPSTIPGITLNMLRILTTVGNRSAKGLAQRLGILSRLKKVFRGVKKPGKSTQSNVVSRDFTKSEQMRNE